jgi:cytochrome P450
MNLDLGLGLLREYDDVRLRSPRTAPDRFLPCGFLRGMEPENHRIYRRLVQSLITPEVLSVWEGSIAGDVRTALTRVAGNPQGGVYTKPVWDELLLISFARLFFGISSGTEEFRKLEAGYRVLSRVSYRRIAVPWLPSERLVETTLQDMCKTIQQHSTSDSLLAEIRNQHPQYAKDPQLLRLLIFTLHFAASDMAGLLQWFAKTLCDLPEAGLRLRSELDAGIAQTHPNSLADRMMFETLRRCQVEHLYRRVLEDIEWEGYRIPKGWLVRICLAEAHRDPAVFTDPDKFIVERFDQAPPTQKQFLPFGAFKRSCLGESVARIFCRHFLCTWAQGWNGHQIGESHEDYAAWHWTPGSDFRLVLRPRSGSAPAENH